MKRTLFLLVGLGFALPVAASPSVPLKCAANTERIWVYDDLTTLDVSVRLKCGTPVEVLGLEKGYVKVRTVDGNEGYVPTDAIPSSDLAQLTAAAPTQVALTPASAARANAQMAQQSSPAQASAPVLMASRLSATPAPSMPLPAPAATPAPAAPPAQQTQPLPAPTPVPSQAPAPAPSAPPVSRAATIAAAPPHPDVSIPAVSSNPQGNAYAATVVITPVDEPEQSAAPAKPRTAPSAATQPRSVRRDNTTLVVEEMNQPSAAMPAVASVVKASDVTPVTKRSLPSSVRTPAYSDDDEDTPDSAAIEANDLSTCSVYFSAYGVTPMQYKWIAGDLRKRFPGVCPAPEPSMVDYVVIFTHDMNFFSTTLPDPIHTDKNGFSDWSPVTAVDDAEIPVSSLDKAHHEYAWVFRVHRGTFDPGNFTSRRHPQFTKAESSLHASSKSIEDAMQFIAQNSSIQ